MTGQAFLGNGYRANTAADITASVYYISPHTFHELRTVSTPYPSGKYSYFELKTNNSGLLDAETHNKP
jgi:hypothetical protein